MSDIVRRLKLNKFSLFITLFIACAAALCTLFFALFQGISNLATIVFRVFISFALFTVLGYFISGYLENEYLSLMKTVNAADGMDNSELQTAASEQNDQELNKTDSDMENNQVQQDNPSQDAQTAKPVADDSFDKIVVVNNEDSEE